MFAITRKAPFRSNRLYTPLCRYLTSSPSLYSGTHLLFHAQLRTPSSPSDGKDVSKDQSGEMERAQCFSERGKAKAAKYNKTLSLKSSRNFSTSMRFFTTKAPSGSGHESSSDVHGDHLPSKSVSSPESERPIRGEKWSKDSAKTPETDSTLTMEDTEKGSKTAKGNTPQPAMPGSKGIHTDATAVAEGD